MNAPCVLALLGSQPPTTSRGVESLIYRRSVGAAEAVSEPAHGANGIVVGAGSFQLAAGIVHVDVDDVRGRLEPVAPDLLAQLVAGEHDAGVAHQVLEQGELGAGELD